LSGTATSSHSATSPAVAAWAEPKVSDAQTAASAALKPIADEFIAAQRDALATEAQSLDAWLRARVGDLTGKAQAAATQQKLFGENAEPVAPWEGIKDPVARLAAFATDNRNAPKSRAEAQTVVKLYQDRKKDIDSRGKLTVPAVEVLGLLMLVPKDGNGEARRGARA
jgi:hypothetical protein